MVLIEPETKNTYEEEKRFSHQFYEKESAVEVPIPQPQAETRSIIDSQKEFWKGVFNDIKKAISGIKFKKVSVQSLALSPKKKAEHYLKRCWNHMARNEVERARVNYDKLVNAYENMEEGSDKTQMYYEVYEIYQRLSEVN